MDLKAVIEVEVTDPLRGSLSLLGFVPGMRLLAVERAPGIWRVNDGTRDFTFTQAELEQGDWIRMVERVSDKL